MRDSQEKMVLDHLINKSGLTSLEAIQEYGITRISDRIYTLRKKGYNIESIPITARNRYNKIVRFVRYELQKWKPWWSKC